MVYTPQRNERVERKHRHLLDTTRSLMLHVGMPKRLWGECIRTATYLINRMPMKVLDWKSPFEVLFNRVPSFDHLSVVGCLCYAAAAGKGRERFDRRSRRCAF